MAHVVCVSPSLPLYYDMNKFYKALHRLLLGHSCYFSESVAVAYSSEEILFKVTPFLKVSMYILLGQYGKKTTGNLVYVLNRKFCI